MKTFILILAMFFLLPFASPEINNFASVEKGSCSTIKQLCATCTYVNVSIAYPNSSLAITNKAMSDQGGGAWIYEFCNTSSLGRYDILGSGDLDGSDTGFDVLYFSVTPTGADEITEGQGTVVMISFIIMIVMSAFFSFLFSIADGGALKIIFGGVAGLMLLMTVFYSVVLMDQNLGNFTSLVSSYSTFLMVIKVIVGLAMLTLLIYGLYRSFIMWQIKRGFRDD